VTRAKRDAVFLPIGVVFGFAAHSHAAEVEDVRLLRAPDYKLVIVFRLDEKAHIIVCSRSKIQPHSH